MGENTLKVVQRAAIAADQTAVLKTPVDTGRARSNWLVSVGAPRFEVPNAGPGGKDAKAEATNKALEHGRQQVLGYQLGQGGIFITNSVPYVGLLDAGSSEQAPKGMTADALRAAQKQLGDARLLKGT